MSYSTTVLNRWCAAERGRQLRLVEKTGIHGGNLSKCRSGKRDLTLDMVSRIIPELDSDTAANFLVAWLRDQTPDCGKSLVNVIKVGHLPQKTIHLDELTRAWELLRDEAERNPALQKIILNLAALTERIRGNISVSEPTAMVAETPDDAYNADKPDPQQK